MQHPYGSLIMMSINFQTLKNHNNWKKPWCIFTSSILNHEDHCNCFTPYHFIITVEKRSKDSTTTTLAQENKNKSNWPRKITPQALHSSKIIWKLINCIQPFNSITIFWFNLSKDVSETEPKHTKSITGNWWRVIIFHWWLTDRYTARSRQASYENYHNIKILAATEDSICSP